MKFTNDVGKCNSLIAEVDGIKTHTGKNKLLVIEEDFDGPPR